MSRGTDLADGHYVIDEGIDRNTGVGTRFHFQGDQIIVERYQDMEAELEHCRRMREKFAGQTWGEGKPVGRIPPLYYDEILKAGMRGGRKERERVTRQFFIDHPEFVYFPAYLKNLKA